MLGAFVPRFASRLQTSAIINGSCLLHKIGPKSQRKTLMFLQLNYLILNLKHLVESSRWDDMSSKIKLNKERNTSSKMLSFVFKTLSYLLLSSLNDLII